MTNDLDDQLTRTLREHAGDAGTPRLDLDAVRGRARRIRRTRTALVGAGAAAVVLAVVAPLGLLGGGSSDRSVDPVTGGTASADRTRHLLMDLGDLPEGAPAEVPYRLDGVLHLPGGATYELPFDAISGSLGDVVPYAAGGWLATVDPGRGGEYDLYHLDGQGELVEILTGLDEERLVNPTLAYDPATGRVAWVESSIGAGEGGIETLVVADADGDELWRRPLATGPNFDPVSRPLGFRGDDVIVEAQELGRSVRTIRLTQDGIITVLSRTPSDAVSPDGSLVARPTGETGELDQACRGVYPAGEDAPLAWSTETCATTYGLFDRDSRWVTAGPYEQYAEAGGLIDSVRDARNGRGVLQVNSPEGTQTFVRGGAWEGSSSLIVEVQQSMSSTAPARYALVRIDVDSGRAELAAPIEDYDAEWDNGAGRFFVK
ncbi:hypothetical protein QE364_002592 [Nocardioides zeae]|uniref:Uncharacterized protein n=2 Tax=Nocardioides zeae TaxID=1457234 RepID=A0AAJ1X0V2_9ACTN|nr:hypothetical protein [Nocardioides zeae]MDQ1102759.1 hypothetical protein [Nocardioides zeae]MDR6173467.1 hypothetical protein [Nocardioides zeae]MDR6210873.1 hypothetical protein [Nocardioides zeae]